VLVIGADFVGHLDEMEPALKSVERIVVIGDHPATRATRRGSRARRIN
jgi:hypothetical protein